MDRVLELRGAASLRALPFLLGKPLQPFTMRNISFAWTTPMLVTGNKRCTRRDWNHDYAVRWLKEDLAAAYERQPRFKGKQVGIIRLTETPRYTGELPEEDYANEGFAFAEEHGLLIDGIRPQVLWRAWQIEAAQGRKWWVVRFEIVEINDYGRELAAKYEEPNLPNLPALPLLEGD